MGLDELLSFHETAGRFLAYFPIGVSAGSNPIEGYGYAWTMVALIVAIPVGLILLGGFLKIFRDDRKPLWLLIASALIFLAGAVGFENVQVYMKHQGNLEAGPSIFLILEEGLEMFAVTIAVVVFYWHSLDLQRGLDNGHSLADSV